MEISPTSVYVGSGYFNYQKLNVGDFELEDFAWAISQMCRFNGHTQSFYSVAQHSYVASLLAPARYKMEALLHDIHESVMGDLPSPLKKLLPQYSLMEDRVAAAFREWYGVPSKLSTEVQLIDLHMLNWERKDILECDDNWGLGVVPEEILYPMSQADSYQWFMRAYYAYFGGDFSGKTLLTPWE